MNTLKNKTVVVTGAASGIGAALAHELALSGAKLMLADVDSTRLHALASELREHGVTCLTQVCDVAQPEAVQALASRTATELGGADVLINNAGVALIASVQSMSMPDARWLMDINFWGVVHGCRAFAEQMQAKPGCVIVNVSSIFGMISMPTQAIYNASKGAVRAFSDALREELRGTSAGHGVRVLCVHPGGIRTRLVEQARLGDISGVANDVQALNREFNRVARTSASQAAVQIVRALSSNATRLLIGHDARVLDWLYRLNPSKASQRFHSLLRWMRKRRGSKP